jgi:hypothetical protein
MVSSAIALAFLHRYKGTKRGDSSWLKLFQGSKSQEHSMAIQIVMDHTGDRRYRFDPNESGAVVKAEKRFKELTEAGFIAAERTGTGESRQVKSFNPTAEQTLFFPRLVGG